MIYELLTHKKKHAYLQEFVGECCPAPKVHFSRITGQIKANQSLFLWHSELNIFNFVFFI